MSAASPRWLRSASMVPVASVQFRGSPILRSRIPPVFESGQSQPTRLTISAFHHPRRGYTSSVPGPQQAPEQTPNQPPAQPTESHSQQTSTADTPLEPVHRSLPFQCPGCGAFSQTNENTIAGFYGIHRKAVKNYLRPPTSRGLDAQAKAGNDVIWKLLETMSREEIERLKLGKGFIAEEVPEEAIPPPEVPLCDRCHGIIHHHKGVSIYHPSVESLRRTIAESPYNDNHVYHVIDAADFPMSLVPRLNEALGGVALRTRNRRSRQGRYLHGQKVEMSFVITRSDLLAPKKEQVDGLLPYLRDTLRDALSRADKNARLGNVHLVSAKRSWWTSDLKQKIWDRGGAAWMVGKVNVGKSQLFEAIFPKGRVGQGGATPSSPMTVDTYARTGTTTTAPAPDDSEALVEEPTETPIIEEPEDEDIDLESLLPPAQKLTNYPLMPTVSALPGTTASPIRIPFGNNKGELIDLPGLARGDLELFVEEEFRHNLVMKSRIIPEQQSIRPGQSLLLGGGLIRITPRTPDLLFLAYSFTPISPHVTSTEKAIGLQHQSMTANIERIMTAEGAACIQSAGTFELTDDVTKSRSGPITRNDFLAKKVADLPWRVLATDILIEGVGWIELVAQVRAKYLFSEKPVAAESVPLEAAAATEDQAPAEQDGSASPGSPLARMEKNSIEAQKVSSRLEESIPEWEQAPAPPTPNWPVIEVFSPKGRFVASRRCMNGWMLNKPLVLDKHKRSRPRKSMKGQKKLAKQRAREARARSSAQTAP